MLSVAKNAVYNVIYRVVNVIYPLITSVYVSRILLVEGIGKVSSAQNIVNYFVIIAALGIPTYGTKIIASVKKNPQQINTAFSELLIINSISTAVCTVLYYLLIVISPYFYEGFKLYAVCGIMIPLNFINVDWFYQGQEQYGYIMKRNIYVKCISLLLIFGLVKTSDDYINYAIILSLGTSLNYFFNILHLRNKVRLVFRGINLKIHIKPIMILLASTLAIEIYTLLDTTMLTFLCNDIVVGYYTTAVKAIKVIRTLVTAITAVFLPRLSFYYYNGDYNKFNQLILLEIKILCFITIPTAVGIFLVADDAIIVMFGSSFSGSILAFRLFSISIISVAFSNFIGNQILITVGKENKVLISTIFGACINVILNLMLIGRFQHYGATIASIISEVCVTGIQLYYAREYLNVKINKNYFYSLFFSLLVMVALVVLVQATITAIFIRLFLSVVIGVISFIICAFVLKNDICLICIKKILKK